MARSARHVLGMLAVAVAGALGTRAAAGPDVTVTVTSPAEGAVVGAKFVVRGRVEGAEAGAIVRVNGADAALVGEAFGVSVEVTEEGPFRLKVQYAVVGKPVKAVEHDVLVDLTPPLLDVHTPATEESAHATGEVTLLGDVLDPHLAGLRMNGEPVRIEDGGAFTATFLLPAEGEVRVAIEAVDLAGNRTEVVRVLRRGTPARPAPSPAPAPSPSTVRPPDPPGPSTPVVLDVVVGGGVELTDGGGTWAAGRLDGPAAADVLASLRARLKEVAWLVPVKPGSPSKRARPLLLRGSVTAQARPLLWLAQLAVEPGVAAGPLLLASTASPGVEVRADVSATGPPAGPGSVIRITLAPAPDGAEGGPGTHVSLNAKPWLLPPSASGATPARERAAALVREELRLRLRADTGARGLVEVKDAERVPFHDLLLVLKAFADVGVPKRWLARDPKTPVGGVASPLRVVRAPPPGVPVPAAPAPGAVPVPPGEVSSSPVAFGHRLDRARGRALGATAQTEEAVESALRWLAAHQSADGSWDAVGFGRWCDGQPHGGTSDGPGKAMYDVGVTGLALTAFLAAGYAPRGEHAYVAAVRRGLTWLRGQQDAEGCFGPRTTQHYVYNHGAAATAMLEAYGLTESPVWHASAQKGLDFIRLARNPYFVWRYGVKPGDNDTSVTGWMMTALHVAERVNAHAAARERAPVFAVDPEAADGIAAFLEKMTDPDFGRVGYMSRGGGTARPAERVDEYPGELSESMTAVGLLARRWAGESPQSALIRKGVGLCLKLPPRWPTHTRGPIDFYYWYYATHALFEVGGADIETWNSHLHPTLLRNQVRGGTPCGDRGSWPPVDPWGNDGGRVYSTAMCALTLATYNRFVRMDEAK